MNTIRHEHGYSLIEVMVAVTILALIGISSMSLSGYHKIIVTKVENRFVLYNLLDALVVDIPYMLSEKEEEFPFLEPEEDSRTYEGEYEGDHYTAVLKKKDFQGTSAGILTLEIELTDGKETARSIIFLNYHDGEKENVDNQ